MQLVLTAFGSYGDVLPMIGLGATAQARGHRVRLIANPYFEPVAGSAGLELVPLGTRDEYEALTHHPDIWRPLRGPQMVLRLGTARYLRACFELLRALYVPGETVVGAHGLDLASRVLQDSCGAPVASIHYAPLSIRSLAAPPKFPGMWLSATAPRWLKSWQFWLADRLVVDRIVAPELNALRGELGLPKVQRVYHAWNQSPQLVLCLFPEWFAAPQADWPSATQLAGFPLYDAAPEQELDDATASFLEAGEKPLVFVPGSANAQANAYFRVAVETCQRLDMRGIFLSKFPEQIPRDLPETIRHHDYVPLSRLLPHAAGLIHHGGIGTSAQGLACGVPQLVMPMAYDQFDNAARLKQLGVGDFLPVKRWRTAEVTSCLKQLLASTTVPQRCAAAARRCDGALALARACDALEALNR